MSTMDPQTQAVYDNAVQNTELLEYKAKYSSDIPRREKLAYRSRGLLIASEQGKAADLDGTQVDTLIENVRAFFG